MSFSEATALAFMEHGMSAGNSQSGFHLPPSHLLRTWMMLRGRSPPGPWQSGELYPLRNGGQQSQGVCPSASLWTLHVAGVPGPSSSRE